VIRDRVVDDFNRFGMPRGLGRDLIVSCSGGRATGLPTRCLENPFTRSNTDCVSQKHPPEKTAFRFPAFESRGTSAFAAGTGPLGRRTPHSTTSPQKSDRRPRRLTAR
jgi:hypothetical protein